MEEKKLKRKGSVGQTERGEMVLVNEQNEGFIVGEIAIVVWDLCEGRSEEEVIDEIISRTHVERERVEPVVTGLISKLKEVKLVE